MKGKLRAIFYGKGKLSLIIHNIIDLKSAIQKRTLKNYFIILKESVKKQVYSKSYQIQNISLKDSLKKAVVQRKHGMKLAFGIALRNATRSKYRSFLLILGITLTIALETGIVVSVDTLYDNFVLDNRKQNYTDITVNPKTWTNLSELRELAKRVDRVAGVSKAGAVYYVTVREFANYQISENILIYGIDPKTHPDFSNLNITEGRGRVSGTTVLISQSIKDGSGVEVGQTVSTPSVYGLRSREVTIGGIISNNLFFGNKFGYLFVIVDIETLYEIVMEEARTGILKPEVDVSVSNLLNIKAIGETIRDEIGLNHFVFIEKDISDIEATGIQAYQTAMNLVIISSFVVEFLFITNILAIAIRDRSREIGILRAIGTNYKQLIESITMEILIYSVIGSILGIIIGIGSSLFLVSIIDDFYAGLTIRSLSIHSSSLFAAFISGITVAIISGLYPIFLALTMPVVHNIHSRMRSGKSSYHKIGFWKYTMSTGALLAFTGFILQFFIGPSRFLDFEVLSIHFLVVILIFLGTLLLEVGILTFLPRIAMKVLFWFEIVTRTISMRNIGREFQKSLFTIMTSALALSFIIIVGLVSAAVISGVPTYFESQWGSIDLIMEARDTDLKPTSFSNVLDSRNDVVRSSYIQEARTNLSNTFGYVFGVDPLKYAYFAEPVLDSIDSYTSSYVFLNQTEGNHTVSGTYCLISRFLFQKLLIPLGSNISLVINNNNTVNITLAAVVKTNAFIGNGEYIYISSTRFQEFFNMTEAKYFICDIIGERESVQGYFRTTYGDSFKDVIGIDFFTRAIEKSLIFQSAIFQVLFIESFILAAIAQFVCILVSTLHMEREMGIMRSMGLHKKGVLNIFMSESTALGLSALIVGTFDGILGSILLAWYIRQSLPIEFVFPIERIAFWLIVSFLITISSTFLPSYRSSKKNVVATISGRPFSKDVIEMEKTAVSAYHLFSSPPQKATFSSAMVASTSMNLEDKSESSMDYFQLNVAEDEHSSLVNSIRLITTRKIQVLTSFLIILAIITFNYIIDANILIIGLIPFDFSWRSFLNISNLFFYSWSNFFLINPFIFFIGLALIGPISHYLYFDRSSSDLFKESMKSLILGLFGIILSILVSILLVLSLLVLISSIFNEPYFFLSDIGVILALALIILIILFALVIYHRVWVFLIFSGLNPNLSIKEKMNYVIRNGSKGQYGFSFLLIIHIIFQSALFYLSHSNEYILNEWGQPIDYISVEIDPWMFLIAASIEIGFFLFLVVYQSVQLKPYHYQKSHDLISMRTAKTQDIEKLKKDASIIAKKLLLKTKIGENLHVSRYSIFPDSIDNNKVLFFQESPNNLPVAMNYAKNWPQSKVKLNNSTKIEVKVPTLEQMNIFVSITKDLEFISEIDSGSKTI